MAGTSRHPSVCFQGSGGRMTLDVTLALARRRCPISELESELLFADFPVFCH